MKTTKSLAETTKKEVIHNLLKENIKHEMMIKHLQNEFNREEDQERKAQIGLKIKQTQDGIEANLRFIQVND